MTDTHPLTLTLERSDLLYVRATLNAWEETLSDYIGKGQSYCLEVEWVRDQAYGAFCILTSLRLYGLASHAYKIYSKALPENLPDD